MYALDVVELSASISEKLTRANPLFVKVTKVINKNTFETTSSFHPVQPEDFWHDDHNNQILTADEKVRRHLQLQRSVGCQSFVLAFVVALKKLCSSGIPLQFQGKQVVDIWVMNTTEFDVSDIPENRILQLRDPISGVMIPALSTYENQDVLRQIGAEVCLRFGYRMPPPLDAREARWQKKTDSYKTTVPHWWVAVIIEGGGDTERFMVHLDVCGAAYDDTGFQNHGGTLVSLQVFTTPEYILFPTKMFGKNIAGEDLSHKFVMTEGTSGPGNQVFSSLQPFSIRHLRCFHWKDRTGVVGVEVTPVDEFVDRKFRDFLGSYDDWLETISEFRHDFMLRAPVGTELIVCNLEKRAELNQKKAVVHECVSTQVLTDRLPVIVDGVRFPIKVKTSCLRFSAAKAYSSFKTLLRRSEPVSQGPTEPMKPLSKRTLAKLQKTIAADPELSEACDKLMTGRVTISFYADPKFVRGMRTLSAAPFDVLLTPSIISSIKDGLEIADHPESSEAFKILKLCKSAKLKAIQQNSSMIRGGGAVAIGNDSEFYRLYHSISQKIKASSGLSEVFEMMDRKGLFRNPAAQVG